MQAACGRTAAVRTGISSILLYGQTNTTSLLFLFRIVSTVFSDAGPLAPSSSAVYAIATNRDLTRVVTPQERDKCEKSSSNSLFYVIVYPYQIRYPTSSCGNTGF